MGTIPSGTTLLLSSNRRVCTNNTSVGDHFTASLSDAVTGSNGATIPAAAFVPIPTATTPTTPSNTMTERGIVEAVPPGSVAERAPSEGCHDIGPP